jgi:Zn-dependent M28 family amino/carboxypeptidase
LPGTRAAARAILCGVAILASLASRCGTEPSGVTTTAVGSRAYELTRELVALGPRPPGSPGIERVRAWISEWARASGFTPVTDRFDADTPLGSIEMKNLSYVIPGRSAAAKVLLVAHYDSKRFAGFDFVGANDAASSVALLMAISPEIAGMKPAFDTEVVLVDGEEALVSWSATDGLYGSRRLAGTLSSGRPVCLAIVVDMVGDGDLLLVRDRNVRADLMRTLEGVLAARGWSALLDPTSMLIEDDHTPLIAAGVPTLHLMDFTYGGPESPGTHWHTAADTIDKVSKTSLSIVGEIILDILRGVK